MPNRNQHKYLDTKQASEYLGGVFTPGTLAVIRCTKRYDIPYIKAGRKVVYDIRDLDAWIEAQRVGGQG